jgi:hypothetical protein
VPNIPRTTVGKAPLIKAYVPGPQRKPRTRNPTTRWFMEGKDV